ncbi:Osw1p [Saccharomyces paradoxus]|uniref:Osw1p n=1 Tax=Saccharomyces paradoxus TaxID=27291 RepID=A0A8B8V032_SACPA|nr:Osw1 [Saccharomyces paradoxus]QHS76343.1 Osw1 [Saccharomyces paradoxus]
MRAPPSPRKSRSGHFLYLYFRLRQFFSCQRLKRRWHVHKLHIHQYNTRWNLSPLSETRIEDMINEPSSLCPGSSKKKPLLIARFSKGCQESPRVYVLQRNSLSRLKLSKRKYALRFYHNEFFGKDLKRKDGSIYGIQHQQCAETVRKIKKVTGKHADVKIIFHDKNTIRSDKLGIRNNRKWTRTGALEEEEEDSSSVYIRFCDDHSLRVKDYHSLHKHSKKTFSQKQSNLVVGKSELLEKLFEEEPLRQNKGVGKKPGTIKIQEFQNYPIVSFSRVI